MKIQILFQEDDLEIGETLEVTALCGNLFRLENSPVFSEGAHYGDVVELTSHNNSWLFIRVAKPSDWNHSTHLVSQNLIESQRFQLWLQFLNKCRSRIGSVNHHV